MVGKKRGEGMSIENSSQSAEAEQSVLGAILLEPKCLQNVIEILPKPDFFNFAENRIIYAHILKLFSSDKPIDFVTVLEDVEKDTEMEKENCKKYFFELAEMVPAISNVDVYAKIVKDKYNMRMLLETARDIIKEATEGSAKTNELLDKAEQRIYEIRQGRTGFTTKKIDKAVIETFNRIDEIIVSGKELPGISTGIQELDQMIMGLNKGNLILLAARPGMGKTSFALNIAQHIALKEQKKVLFFSLEMTTEQLSTRLLSAESNVESQKLMVGNLSDVDWEDIIAAGGRLSAANIYIDDAAGITIPEMKSKIRRLGDVDAVIIDYLQLMSGTERRESRVQEITELTRNLKLLAKEFKVPVLLLSQLSRASEQRAEHRPVLSDLRDSGSIEQDADSVLFLYRDAYYSELSDTQSDSTKGECIVAKNRHGRTGVIPLYWDGDTMRFLVRTDNVIRLRA